MFTYGITICLHYAIFLLIILCGYYGETRVVFAPPEKHSGSAANDAVLLPSISQKELINELKEISKKV